MERVIKFRAWDTKNKKYLGDDYGVLMIDLYGGLNRVQTDSCENPYRELDNYVLEQFTGLHDKHGKEAYENDKLLSGDEETHDEYMQIWWNSEMARFQIALYSRPMFHNEGGSEEWGNDIECIDDNYMEMDCISEFEIIGNIHTNPELINQK